MAINTAEWYKKYGPMVIRRCKYILKNDEEALDAVQDVFLNVLRKKTLIQEKYPSSLLYTIATNVCLNRLRKKKNRFRIDLSPETGIDFPFTDEGFNQVEAKLMMEAIFRDESETDRTVCFMYFSDGMTLKEIGEALGLSAAAVWKKLETFKKRVRIKFSEEVQ